MVFEMHSVAECCNPSQGKYLCILAWGARGPEFKSRRSDQLKRESGAIAVSAFVSTFSKPGRHLGTSVSKSAARRVISTRTDGSPLTAIEVLKWLLQSYAFPPRLRGLGPSLHPPSAWRCVPFASVWQRSPCFA